MTTETLSRASAGVTVNDVHSRLSPTTVARVAPIDGLASLRRALAEARVAGLPVSIAGRKHAMGGQPFGAGGVPGRRSPCS